MCTHNFFFCSSGYNEPNLTPLLSMQGLIAMCHYARHHKLLLYLSKTWTVESWADRLIRHHVLRPLRTVIHSIVFVIRCSSLAGRRRLDHATTPDSNSMAVCSITNGSMNVESSAYSDVFLNERQSSGEAKVTIMHNTSSRTGDDVED